MRIRFLIIPSILICQVTGAQNGTVSFTTSEVKGTAPQAAASSTPVVPPVPPAEPAETTAAPISIMDYKSVYETATVEEEVKMAAERFDLTAAQQDVWLAAAVDRRETEKQVREKLDSKADYDKNGVYRGLRTSQNTFHETVIAYMTPTQKQALEADRLILQEKQKKLAKLPPPAPTVTVAPVDSAAIKETENAKSKGKKSKKKKKAALQ